MDDNVPWTCTHSQCYAIAWVGWGLDDLGGKMSVLVGKTSGHAWPKCFDKTEAKERK